MRGEPMFFKELIKKITLGERYSSASYINHLKNIGVQIGEDVKIFVPSKTLIDESYPWMITIGNHVQITQGVIILTHDFSWSVLKKRYGQIAGASGEVVIGNNVFIGMNAIITRNVHIGNNVIIGTGSIVTKDCESNCIYAGNPARKIMTIDEFYKKRSDLQLEEAQTLAVNYYKCYGKKPGKEIFHEYFMLFSNIDDAEQYPVYSNKLNLRGNRKESIEFMISNPPRFKNFDEFLNYCFKE